MNAISIDTIITRIISTAAMAYTISVLVDNQLYGITLAIIFAGIAIYLNLKYSVWVCRELTKNAHANVDLLPALQMISTATNKPNKNIGFTNLNNFLAFIAPMLYIYTLNDSIIVSGLGSIAFVLTLVLISILGYNIERKKAK